MMSKSNRPGICPGAALALKTEKGYNRQVNLFFGRQPLFRYLTSMFADPRTALMFFLLAIPGRLMAISAHEFAHAWVADKCGDNTARMLGRLTLNPMKHLDLVGTLMMLLVGFGWAKPVPVNPRNYRNYRRDDLLVSIAGIAMNLILFALSFLICAVMVFAIVRGAGADGDQARDFVYYAASIDSDYIAMLSGSRLLGYVYEMLTYFVLVNVSLAIFNLLPVPPLDGYHVLNDMVLKRDLFASGQVARAATGILFLLMFTGYLGTGLSYIVSAVLSGMGSLAQALFAFIA